MRIYSVLYETEITNPESVPEYQGAAHRKTPENCPKTDSRRDQPIVGAHPLQ